MNERDSRLQVSAPASGPSRRRALRDTRGSAFAALAAVLVVVLGSCSVREDLTLDPAGAGEARLSIDLHPIMIDYMNDLMSAMAGVEAEYPLFDLEQIRASFAEREGIELLGVEQPRRGSLRVRVAFEDINEVFAREGGEDILRLEPLGARRELTVRLDRGAVGRFLEFAPPESATMAQFLFPPADGSVSREEYRDEMAWALEEYDERDAVGRVLDEATIEVRVHPRGTIVSQRGGTIDGDAVVFKLPILDLLTITSERTYSVLFEP